MHYLTDKLWFPPLEEASEEGILAIGGDLSVERLLLAYNHGIFPWYEDGQPIIWWSPNPRMVLYPTNFKVSKSLSKIIVKNLFRITYNTNFTSVISQCALIPRKGQAGTWITSELQDAFLQLHELGHAISVEVWLQDSLVGGLYGIDLPEHKIFCGESMFSSVSNASKVAFYHLVEILKERNYKLIDCQVYTKHLASLGAKEIDRDTFVNYLNSYS